MPENAIDESEIPHEPIPKPTQKAKEPDKWDCCQLNYLITKELKLIHINLTTGSKDDLLNSAISLYLLNQHHLVLQLNLIILYLWLCHCRWTGLQQAAWACMLPLKSTKSSNSCLQKVNYRSSSSSCVSRLITFSRPSLDSQQVL